MDPSFSNFYMNPGNSEDYPGSQYYGNAPSFLSPSQVHFTENIQASQDTEKQPRGVQKWDVAEDVALMSSWCIASEDSITSNNQKVISLWTKVKKLYDEAQAENPEKIGKRNVQSMKGRYKRLNESVQKWIGAYREAYRCKTSGMSLKYVESEAHKIYEQEVKNKFNDYVVFNEVMYKHVKWELLPHETTHSRHAFEVEDESGGSTKRSRTTEEGDYSNPETSKSGSSKLQRPIGRDAAKAKRKGKVSKSLVDELHAMRLTRVDEIELLKRKLDLDQEKQNIMKERELKKEERELKKMQLLHLNTLLGKECLSPAEENMKNFLMMKFYGN